MLRVRLDDKKTIGFSQNSIDSRNGRDVDDDFESTNITTNVVGSVGSGVVVVDDTNSNRTGMVESDNNNRMNNNYTTTDNSSNRSLRSMTSSGHGRRSKMGVNTKNTTSSTMNMNSIDRTSRYNDDDDDWFGSLPDVPLESHMTTAATNASSSPLHYSSGGEKSNIRNQSNSGALAENNAAATDQVFVGNDDNLVNKLFPMNYKNSTISSKQQQRQQQHLSNEDVSLEHRLPTYGNGDNRSIVVDSIVTNSGSSNQRRKPGSNNTRDKDVQSYHPNYSSMKSGRRKTSVRVVEAPPADEAKIYDNKSISSRRSNHPKQQSSSASVAHSFHSFSSRNEILQSHTQSINPENNGSAISKKDRNQSISSFLDDPSDEESGVKSSAVLSMKEVTDNRDNGTISSISKFEEEPPHFHSFSSNRPQQKQQLHKNSVNVDITTSSNPMTKIGIANRKEPAYTNSNIHDHNVIFNKDDTDDISMLLESLPDMTNVVNGKIRTAPSKHHHLQHQKKTRQRQRRRGDGSVTGSVAGGIDENRTMTDLESTSSTTTSQEKYAPHTNYHHRSSLLSSLSLQQPLDWLLPHYRRLKVRLSQIYPSETSSSSRGVLDDLDRNSTVARITSSSPEHRRQMKVLFALTCMTILFISSQVLTLSFTKNTREEMAKSATGEGTTMARVQQVDLAHDTSRGSIAGRGANDKSQLDNWKQRVSETEMGSKPEYTSRVMNTRRETLTENAAAVPTEIISPSELLETQQEQQQPLPPKEENSSLENPYASQNDKTNTYDNPYAHVTKLVRKDKKKSQQKETTQGVGAATTTQNIGDSGEPILKSFTPISKSQQRPSQIVSMYWCIHKSGCATFKQLFSSCLDLTIASEAGGAVSSGNTIQVQTSQDRNKYLSIDTMTLSGISRAKELLPLQERNSIHHHTPISDIVNVVVSPFLYEINDLFAMETRRNPDIAATTAAVSAGNNDIIVLSLFTHPIQRAITLFYNNANHDADVQTQTAALVEYVKSPYCENNWMTRFLSDARRKHGANTSGSGLLGDTELKLAKQMLSTHILVGLSSYYEKSMERFRLATHHFGKDSNIDDQQQQKTCVQKQMSSAQSEHYKYQTLVEELAPVGSEAHSLLMDKNFLDMKLYDHAVQLFHGEQQQLISSLQQELL